MVLRSFEIAVSDEAIADLRDRLGRTRWPIDFANDDWRYGTNRTYLQELVEYWQTSYDWRKHEAAMNSYAHYMTDIDGVPIHFLREPGVGPAPIPLLLTHGWPETFWDYEKTIKPLSDPGAFGGDPADAFDVILPSLPGFGFSAPLTRPGVEFGITADLWLQLMRDELGYSRFAAHGEDAGMWVTSQLGHKHPQHLIGVHLTIPVPLGFVTSGLASESDFADDEKAGYEHTVRRMAHASSHVAVHTSEPQTLAYSLNDSPVGMLAWMLDRRRSWSGCEGELETVFTKDELLTGAMIYWVTETSGSAARFYWEWAHNPWEPTNDRSPVVSAPTGITCFPDDLIVQPKAWMESYYNLRHLTYQSAGGHFAPLEQPDALVADIRTFFRPLR